MMSKELSEMPSTDHSHASHVIVWRTGTCETRKPGMIPGHVVLSILLFLASPPNEFCTEGPAKNPYDLPNIFLSVYP